MELLRLLGAGRLEHRLERVRGPHGVVAEAGQDRDRAVLHEHLAVRGRLREALVAGRLELAADGTEEVLVDHDGVVGVGVADRDAEVALAGVRGLDVLLVQHRDQDGAADDQHEDRGDTADHQQPAALLGSLLRGPQLGGLRGAGGRLGRVRGLRGHQLPWSDGGREEQVVDGQPGAPYDHRGRRRRRAARRRVRSPRGTTTRRPSSAPPPPKHPQSISMPRAHTDAIPTMNATNSSRRDGCRATGEGTDDEGEADDQLDRGQRRADRLDQRPGQQLVGPDGGDAGCRLGDLESTGDDPDAARDQARDQAQPRMRPAFHGS